MLKRKPFIKWAGGKESEWPIIKENLPSHFERYIEPFVGGGAVYLNIDCKKSIINDKSDELMLLYKLIKNKDNEFYKSLKQINNNWILLENFVIHTSDELFELYNDYKNCEDMLEELVEKFINKHEDVL